MGDRIRVVEPVQYFAIAGDGGQRSDERLLHFAISRLATSGGIGRELTAATGASAGLVRARDVGGVVDGGGDGGGGGGGTALAASTAATI
jgi:hypothetical protein